MTHVLPVKFVRFTSLGSLSSSAIATATKTSLESKHLRNGDYFVPQINKINPSSSHPLLLTEQCNCTGRSVVGLNVENERFTVACSRCRLADYVKEFYLSACRTCSTIIFPHSTNQIVLSWRGVVAVAVVLSSAPFYVFTPERAFQIFVSTSETKFRPNCFHAACTN